MAAWLVPLVFAFAGCGDSDPLSPPPDSPDLPDAVDTTPPSVPSGVHVGPLSQRLVVTWSANSDADLAGYRIVRSFDHGVTWWPATSGLLQTTTFQDDFRSQVWYRVAAVDASSNVSAYSGAAVFHEARGPGKLVSRPVTPR
jgi:hypothetical protein